MAIEHVPGAERLVGFNAEGIDYFATQTTYPATATLTALAGTQVSCPAFATYSDTLLDFMISHPDVSSAAMV
jgi:hypothetical protein